MAVLGQEQAFFSSLASSSPPPGQPAAHPMASSSADKGHSRKRRQPGGDLCGRISKVSICPDGPQPAEGSPATPRRLKRRRKGAERASNSIPHKRPGSDPPSHPAKHRRTQQEPTDPLGAHIPPATKPDPAASHSTAKAQPTADAFTPQPDTQQQHSSEESDVDILGSDNNEERPTAAPTRADLGSNAPAQPTERMAQPDRQPRSERTPPGRAAGSAAEPIIISSSDEEDAVPLGVRKANLQASDAAPARPSQHAGRRGDLPGAAASQEPRLSPQAHLAAHDLLRSVRQAAPPFEAPPLPSGTPQRPSVVSSPAGHSGAAFPAARRPSTSEQASSQQRQPQALHQPAAQQHRPATQQSAGQHSISQSADAHKAGHPRATSASQTGEIRQAGQSQPAAGKPASRLGSLRNGAAAPSHPGSQAQQGLGRGAGSTAVPSAQPQRLFRFGQRLPPQPAEAVPQEGPGKQPWTPTSAPLAANAGGGAQSSTTQAAADVIRAAHQFASNAQQQQRQAHEPPLRNGQSHATPTPPAQHGGQYQANQRTKGAVAAAPSGRCLALICLSHMHVLQLEGDFDCIPPQQIAGAQEGSCECHSFYPHHGQALLPCTATLLMPGVQAQGLLRVPHKLLAPLHNHLGESIPPQAAPAASLWASGQRPPRQPHLRRLPGTTALSCGRAPLWTLTRLSNCEALPQGLPSPPGPPGALLLGNPSRSPAASSLSRAHLHSQARLGAAAVARGAPGAPQLRRRAVLPPPQQRRQLLNPPPHPLSHRRQSATM